MKTNIKAIETVYKGYRFRSRLEARWAVFFDALGLEWGYEVEGLDLGGLWYLPDFYIPDLEYRWIEIKPRLPGIEWPDHPVFNKYDPLVSVRPDDQGLTQEFVNHFVLLAGTPWVSPENVHIWDNSHYRQYVADSDTFEYEGFVSCDNSYRWCECPVCGKVGLQYDGRAGRLCGCIDDDKVYSTATPRLIKAYTAAREARIEKGRWVAG